MRGVLGAGIWRKTTDARPTWCALLIPHRSVLGPSSYNLSVLEQPGHADFRFFWLASAIGDAIEDEDFEGPAANAKKGSSRGGGR